MSNQLTRCRGLGMNGGTILSTGGAGTIPNMGGIRDGDRVRLVLTLEEGFLDRSDRKKNRPIYEVFAPHAVSLASRTKWREPRGVRVPRLICCGITQCRKYIASESMTPDGRLFFGFLRRSPNSGGN